MTADQALELLQAHVGGCREWPGNATRCGAPSEYVLWGKLIPPMGLGPRCRDHAAMHIDRAGLAPNSGYAVIHLAALAKEIASA